MGCATIVQSSLRDFRFVRLSNPAINRWAILKRPSGTRKRELSREAVSSIVATITRISLVRAKTARYSIDSKPAGPLPQGMLTSAGLSLRGGWLRRFACPEGASVHPAKADTRYAGSALVNSGSPYYSFGPTGQPFQESCWPVGPAIASCAFRYLPGLRPSLGERLGLRPDAFRLRVIQREKGKTP